MSVNTLINSNRFGEQGPTPPRSTRVFSLKESWYFSTREGANIGPFETRDQADLGVQNFIDFLKLASPRMLELFVSSLRQGSEELGMVYQ